MTAIAKSRKAVLQSRRVLSDEDIFTTIGSNMTNPAQLLYEAICRILDFQFKFRKDIFASDIKYDSDIIEFFNMSIQTLRNCFAPAFEKIAKKLPNAVYTHKINACTTLQIPFGKASYDHPEAISKDVRVIFNVCSRFGINLKVLKGFVSNGSKKISPKVLKYVVKGSVHQ